MIKAEKVSMPEPLFQVPAQWWINVQHILNLSNNMDRKVGKIEHAAMESQSSCR